MKPIPTSRKEWLVELSVAFGDAAEIIPFGPIVGTDFDPEDLFQLGPITALKCRGIRPTKRIVKQVTEAALASYIATSSLRAGSLSHPAIGFAFTFLVAHFALDLVTEKQATDLLEYIETHPASIMPPSSRHLFPLPLLSSPPKPRVKKARASQRLDRESDNSKSPRRKSTT